MTLVTLRPAADKRMNLMSVVVETGAVVSPKQLKLLGMTFRRIFDDDVDPQWAIRNVYENNHMGFQEEVVPYPLLSPHS